MTDMTCGGGARGAGARGGRGLTIITRGRLGGLSKSMPLGFVFACLPWPD
jgi:hypothetical protein